MLDGWFWLWGVGSLWNHVTAALSIFFFSSRRRHTRLQGDWSSDVCSSDLRLAGAVLAVGGPRLVLGDRHPQRRAVHPDGAAVDQQRPRRAQRVGELPRRAGDRKRVG